MIKNLFNKVVGTRNDRQLRRMHRSVERINALEPENERLSDAELRARTDVLRGRVGQGESLEEVLPEAFAVVREAGRRTLEMRHFDVQLLGGITLHEGRISEMRTGEGKTLVATLPAYLNALTGASVHIVTVNDYLAKRDARWMGAIYEFLGMRTGVVVPGMDPRDKRDAYAADVVYATNNELGFDYLRDNMAFSNADKMQRELTFAIVDEVDSILIDEARTPLIISGPTDETSELYVRVDRVIPRLERQVEEDGPGDYSVDEKAKQVHLTEDGHETIEAVLVEAGILPEGQSLYDPSNIVLVHHLNAALRAHALFHRNVEYIVRDGQIVIVDEFTGRTMPGRRWSEGLHQAIEAKEGVPIQSENQTLASITFQNYFRLYDKLAGMTGTADTEAAEFQQIYGLEVVVVPTHLEMIRDDMADLVFLSQDEKFEAVLEDIRDCTSRRQPVLVGTTSIETSELLSGRLGKAGVEHEVLNAKQHAREAVIVAQAGRPGAVTIATNMAGRGTDIVLGGNLVAELEELAANDAGEAELEASREAWRERHDAVVAAGGLHIVGTERHESRPHRQSAPRPFRASGRSGVEPFLPLSEGRPDAEVRIGPRRRDHAEARHGARRGHRAPLGDEGDRERPAQGRSVQLRHPQAAPGVRRRRQRPAPGGLHAAQGADGSRRRLGAGRGAARGRRERGDRRVHSPREPRRAVGTSPGSRRRWRTSSR